MGTNNIFNNFGVTMMFGIGGLILSMLIVVILTLLCKNKLSEKNQKRLHDLKIKLFYSSTIRFAMANCLKFNLNGFMAIMVLKD